MLIMCRLPVVLCRKEDLEGSISSKVCRALCRENAGCIIMLLILYDGNGGVHGMPMYKRVVDARDACSMQLVELHALV